MNKAESHIGQVVRSAREKLGLTEEFVADSCGLSMENLGDLELHGGEFFTNISLGTARRICLLLNIDLLALTARFLGARITARSPIGNGEFFSRHELVLRSRVRLGLSEKQLAHRIGFAPATVEFLERTPDFIESLPICVVVDTAVALKLDPGVLLCNRPRDF